ncbi:MAG: hypothetical protein WCT12_25910 [Verrucomicrobiota bacterium]
MKAWRIYTIIGCLVIGCAFTAQAQLGWVAKAARQLVEGVAAKGGQQAAKELAEMGGDVFAREALEKAAQEGGEKLAQKLVSQTIEYGPALLKVSKSSPSQFISAFEELTPAMQKAAAQAMTREPDLMAQLFSNVGRDALTAAGKHPGVGTKVMETLGREGAETLGKITTDQAIQLSRLAPQLAKVAEPERRTLMEMIGKAPGKTLDLLEMNPKVMLTGAGVGLLIANREQIFGGAEIATDKDGVVRIVKKPGFIERMWGQTTETFSAPLGALIWIAASIVLGWGAIKLWAVFRIEQSKVRINAAHLAQEDKRAREQVGSTQPRA